jgi:predicted RNA binding protein YcfA (HicA-like mRNA interferase family)
MPKLPSLPGAKVVRAFERLGFRHVRTNGSHHILTRPGHPFNLSVPVHGNRPVAQGTLRDLIRDAGVTVEDFLNAL